VWLRTWRVNIAQNSERRHLEVKDLAFIALEAAKLLMPAARERMEATQVKPGQKLRQGELASNAALLANKGDTVPAANAALATGDETP
jgi:hypothetical protein